MSPFRERKDGLDVFVRLTPRSSRDAVDGVGESADGSRHLIARVRAVPEKGAANQALEKLLAERLDVPRSTVAVVSGQTSRLKTVRITGNAETLSRKVREASGPGIAGMPEQEPSR